LVCFAPANRASSDPGDESSSGTADPEAAFRWGLSQRRVALLTIVVAVGVVICVGRTPGRGGELASETTIASCASTASRLCKAMSQCRSIGRERDDVGMAIIRTARLRSLARGGQVLVSSPRAA